MAEEKVILVNENDTPVGEMEKMEAHRKALLHRAFSVFVFNDKKELLLQQRAAGKYHSPLLWTNTCCSHPRPAEKTEDAAHRRLMEEMGFDCQLNEIFSFTYKEALDQGLTEHEFDHVFIGNFDGIPVINPDEVQSWKWMKMEAIALDLVKNPGNYTVWFRIAFERVMQNLIT